MKSLRAGLLATMLLGAGAPVWGQATVPPMSCSASASAVPVRAGGLAERVSDIVVTCSGGFPTATNTAVPNVTFTIGFGATVTSRLLAAGWSEALLVVDEPAPSSQLACTTPSGICSITGTGTGATTYSGAVGRPNVFQGSVSGASSLSWTIPLDPPGSGGQRRLRFTNLRTLADFSPGTNIQAVISASGQLPFTLNNQSQTLGVVQSGITSSVGSITSVDGRLTGFTVNIAEGFTRAFKSQSSGGPLLSTQAGPNGASTDFEVGFYNPALGGSVRGALSNAGVANSGTRIRMRLNGLPAQTTVTVPTTINTGGGLARLVATDASGAGSYTPATSGTAVITGTGTAVYEIVQSSAIATETLSIPVTLSYANNAPLFPNLTGDVALAPQSSTQTADGLSPIPRFTGVQTIRVQEPLRITTPTLSSGVVGVNYSQTILATGGGLPYTFSTAPGTLPPGLTFSSAGVLSGTPTTPGSYRFTVALNDGLGGSVNVAYTLDILTAPPLQVSTNLLEFNALQDGDPPPARNVLVNAPQLGQNFTVTVDNGTANTPQPAWIQVSPMSGITPALLTVRADQGSLTPGTYFARIRVAITGNANASSEIQVRLVVSAAPPKLSALPAVLRIDTRLANPGRRFGFILLRNSGGGGNVRFTTSILKGSRWIQGVTPSTGQTGRLSAALLRVEVDSTGLPQGNYRDVVRITSDAGTVDVPVILRIAANGPQLDLSRTGLRFSMREGGTTLQIRDVKLLNRDPNSTLQWNAEVIRGGDHFALSPASGSASQGSPGLLRIGIRQGTSALPPGVYSGIVRVSSPGAISSPRYLMVVLHVRPAAQNPEIDLDPGGIVLTGTARSTTPITQTVTLNASSNTAIGFQAAGSTTDGGGWLSVNPGTGSVSSAQPQTLTVRADVGNLVAGVYTGEVTVATSGDSATLSVTLILTDPAGDVPEGARSAACNPNRLALGSTGLSNQFSIAAGWPAAISVDVRDNCGAKVTNATVVARFSNGDPPLPLQQEASSGVYSATWQPGAVLPQTNVTVDAVTGDFGASSLTLVGGVTPNAVPTLYRNGTIHNLDPQLGGLLSPGLVVQIYGEGLAASAESTEAVPLATTYKGTTVLVGPYEAPLYYVSPGQLVAQLPSELQPNASYPILVVANNQVTIPDEVDVVGVQPGVAAFLDGTLIAQHSDFSLVTPENPAKRGEFLIMYLVGLGATNPAVASGFPSPGVAPLGIPTVAPSVSIGGSNAEIGFAGLTPFGVGLYQINFRVPANAPTGTPVEVIVTQGAASSNVTKLTVAP